MIFVPFLTFTEGQVGDRREMKKRHLNLPPQSKVDQANEANWQLLQLFTFKSKQVGCVRLQDATAFHVMRISLFRRSMMISNCVIVTTVGAMNLLNSFNVYNVHLYSKLWEVVAAPSSLISKNHCLLRDTDLFVWKTRVDKELSCLHSCHITPESFGKKFLLFL